MKLYKSIYYRSFLLLTFLISFISCSSECIDDPIISSYVNELYIENADQSKTYYIRQIRRNVKGVWLVSIGEANSIAEDKADGSSQVLVFSLGKNIESEKVLSLTPINGFNGFGYISLDWTKIPEGNEILCRAKINSNAFKLRRGGIIAQYLDNRYGTFLKSSHHERFQALEKKGISERRKIKNSADNVIKVSTQEEFYNLEKTLVGALKNSSKNIIVELANGKYLFDDSHLKLKGINNPELNITIKGSGNTVLIGSKSLVAKQYSYYDESHAYLSTDWNNKDLWSEIKQMNDTIEVVDRKSKLCRFKATDRMDTRYNPKCRVKISEWFKVLVYDVFKIENGYIYFYAPELSYTNWLKCYNVNNDWGFGKKYPRYRLFEGINNTREPLIDCSSSQFINVENCKLKSFCIENIGFKGCALRNPSLISITNVDAEDFRVSKCQFSAIRNIIVNVVNSHNVTLEENMVKDNYIDCFMADNTSTGFVVKGNTFQNNGLYMNQTTCISARGKNFLISGNEISDFSYSAISVGMNYQWQKGAICSGIVENNEIHYSPEYFNHPEKYTLMDSGAIYVMTQLDGVVVRYNRVYDYCGLAENRGIFCDDGTKNISIYGNVVTNVPNSFSIDLRVCPQVSNRVPDHNTNIVMMYNVVDGKYRFQGVDKSSAFLGRNIQVKRSSGVVFNNVVSDVSLTEEDYFVDGYAEIGTKNVNLQTNSGKLLKESPIKTYVSQYIKKK